MRLTKGRDNAYGGGCTLTTGRRWDRVYSVCECVCTCYITRAVNLIHAPINQADYNTYTKTTNTD